VIGHFICKMCVKCVLQVKGRVGLAHPLRVCGDLLNPELLRGRIAIMERGDCMFVEKVSESL
jgi:mannosidase alpha-like ER degradation enhancer 3